MEPINGFMIIDKDGKPMRVFLHRKPAEDYAMDNLMTMVPIKICPVEPSESMIMSGYQQCQDMCIGLNGPEDVFHIYKAMTGGSDEW